MRTVRARASSTNATTASATMRGTIKAPLLVYERRRALDFHHFYPGSGLDHLVGHECARRPLLAADANPPAVIVYALKHDCVRPFECRRTRADRGRHVQVPPGERPQHRERRGRDRREHDQLQPHGGAECRDDRGDTRAERDRAEEEEAGREDLPYYKQDSRNDPHEPRHDLDPRYAQGFWKGVEGVEPRLVRAPEPQPVDEHGLHPERACTLDVVLERVADHRRLLRIDVEEIEHGAKDRRVRLRLPVMERADARVDL